MRPFSSCSILNCAFESDFWALHNNKRCKVCSFSFLAIALLKNSGQQKYKRVYKKLLLSVSVFVFLGLKTVTIFLLAVHFSLSAFLFSQRYNIPSVQ